jgi:hypothetical protein
VIQLGLKKVVELVLNGAQERLPTFDIRYRKCGLAVDRVLSKRSPRR